MDDAYLRGVAANPSTPTEMLLRLAGRAGTAFALLSREHLPHAVAAVLATHHDAHVRCELATHPSTPGDVLAVLAADADPQVRAEVASWPNWRIGRLADPPVEVYRTLAADPDPRVRAHVARNHHVPEHVRATLADDADPEVRRSAAVHLLPTDVLHRLIGDPDPAVRRAALWTASAFAPERTIAPELAELFDGVDRKCAVALIALTPELIERYRDDRDELARNPSLPVDLMPEYLSPDLAQNPNLPAALLPTLVDTMDPEIHRELLRRTDVPDHLLRRLLAASEEDEPLPVARSLHGRLSYLDHPNPAFRRTLALADDLPPHAVHALARDPDWATRLLICERNTDVPPDVLVEVAEGHGGHSRWDLFRHPRLPADAVARNAAGDDPLVRHAIATRTDVPPDLVVRLTDDERIEVRRAAAANPALPPDRRRQLLDGADPVLREAAASNPALTVEELERLIRPVSGGPS